MSAAPTRSTWLRAALTAAVLVYLGSRISLADAAAAIFRLAPWAALVVAALLAVDRAVMIWRWIVLLRATGQPVRAKSAAWIYLVSSFVGSFTPAGIGADVARAYTLGRRTARGHDAAASVAVDRVLGLQSILIVGAVSAAVWGPYYGLDARPLLAVAGALIVGGTLLFLFADAGARATLPAAWRASRVGGKVLRLADAVSQYRGHRSALAAVLALSVLVQLLRIVQAWLLGVGIGIDIPFTYYLLMMPVGLLLLLLPISLGGFGLPQAGIVSLLALEGVPGADAFALSTLIVLSGIVANLPGAWLFLRSR